MAAYTSTGSGNWNDAATWGGGGYPSSAADTATISTKHTITVPAGTTSTCGAVTLTAGTNYTAGNFTSLTINGTFNMGGLVTLNTFSEIRMGPGSILDLNGNNVTAGTAAAARYVFAGTSASRITVRSTGSAGIFTRTSSSNTADWSYVDVSGLGDSIIARGDANNLNQSYRYCTFTNCGDLQLEMTNVAAGAGMLISHCDFINPSNADPITNNKAQPRFSIQGTYGANPRRIEYCTWKTNGTKPNYMFGRCDANLTLVGNIFNEVQISQNSTSADWSFINNFFYMSLLAPGSGQFFANSLRPGKLFHGNYLLNRYGDHPFGNMSATAPNIDLYSNVLETDYTSNLSPGNGRGANWLLYSTITATINIKHNLMLGSGNLICFTNNSTPTMDISANTFYADNAGDTAGGVAYGLAMLTEQLATGLLGTVSIYNNAVLDPDTSNSRDYLVDLLNAAADQVDLLDYNAGYGYTAGTFTPPVQYGTNVNVTAGKGVNDFSADPQLVDRTRNLLAWDVSLGGAGTFANVVAEFLKLNGSGYNSAYNVRDLVKYVFEGFKYQSSSYRLTGRNSQSVGAANYYSSSRDVSSVTGFNTYFSGTYAI